MILLRNVFFRHGDKLLFENISLDIFKGEKVGVIGPNGCGKTSLFSIIAGDYLPDEGKMETHGELMISRVSQSLPDGNQSAIDFVLDGDKKLREIEMQLAIAQENDDGTAISQAHDVLAHIGGYDAKARGARILSGLGFPANRIEKSINEFSGGWKARLNLGKALMSRSAVILLDEPTNHLDLDAIIWLERWLRDYSGVALVISHDRQFLDSFVGTIFHIENHNLRRYPGNYSAFEKQRSLFLSRQSKLSRFQKYEIEKIRDFVARFSAKATKAKQAQSRLRAIRRMERLTVIQEKSPFKFSFKETQLPSDPAIVLNDIGLSYEDNRIFQDMNLTVRSESRIGLLGPNGAGKTTLIKLLAGILKPDSGKRIEGKNIAIGYFAQSQSDNLNIENNALQQFLSIYPNAREKSLRDFLGNFGFKNDMVTRPIVEFSGGEKSRLTLAILIWACPNVLLLDEPTNHLDLDMRISLTIALQQYKGAMVIISHDRSLLSETCNDLYIVNQGIVKHFDGDLNDYAMLLDETEEGSMAPKAKFMESRKLVRRRKARERDRLLIKNKPLLMKKESLEQELNKLNNIKIELEASLLKNSNNAQPNGKKIDTVLIKLSGIRARIDKVESQWMAVATSLEELGN